MKTIDQKTLEELKAKHGEVHVLSAENAGIQVACRRVDRATYKRLKAELADVAKRATAFENLFLACVVFPDREAADRMLDELPALGDSFGTALWDKTIGAEDPSVKKA